MDLNQRNHHLGPIGTVDLTAKPKFWDGVFHGPTDPAGPIGPHNPDDPWGRN